jgi:cyclohexanecarboxylate-CoA ligase
MSVRSRIYPGAEGLWPRETLVERFRAVAAGSPEAEAIVDGGTRLSFRDCETLVARLAGALAGLGVGAGDVVSWQLPNWWESVAVHHAVLRCGAIPNPLNPIYRARELRFILAEAAPRVLFVPGRFRRHDYAATALRVRERVPSVETLVTVRGEASGCVPFEGLLEAAPADAFTRAGPEDVALLLYTSGTTGDPKGVQHTHGTLLYEIDSLRAVHELTPDDRYLGGSPMAHIAGLVYGALMPFALGTSTALLERWDAGHALELIEAEKVTFGTGAPVFLQTLADHPSVGGRDLASFRLFSTGGASIRPEMVRAAARRLGCVVKRAYGSTEAPTLTATTVQDPDEALLSTDGRPIGAAELRIVARDGRDAGPEEEGEIWGRAPEMFVGYRNSALDAEAFAEDGWFRTGDLGTLDERGYLRVTGRLADIIIRGGENISAVEVEDLLLEHPAVAEAAVIGIPDPVMGERVCAVVCLRAGARLSFGEMVEHFESRELASQKIPQRLEFLTRLPRTASGKVRKTQLGRVVQAESD